jgi:mono/diheme cytochrome c family protein
MTVVLRGLALIWMACALAACEKAKQDMYDQPRYKTFAAGPLFDDGASARVPPAGSQPRARGPFAGSTSGRVGTAAVRTDVAAAEAQTNPYPVDLALLERGRDRYMIYCMPCHSPAGDGDGLVVRRGFPAPPTYHQDRLRTAPDRHFYDVITNGYGVMVPYADRVEPADRWAIVAFIRALQFSQHAPAAALPRKARARLEASGNQAAPAPRGPAPASGPRFAPPLTVPPPPLPASAARAAPAQGAAARAGGPA